MSAPRMPANLRAGEKTAWKSLVDELGGSDALEPIDGPLLRSLATLTARLEDLRAALARAAASPPPEPRWRRPDAARHAPVDPLAYLLSATARGVTGNPLLGHERETMKEIRLQHERLVKAIAERNGGRAEKPKSLREMRDSLTAVRGARAKSG